MVCFLISRMYYVTYFRFWDRYFKLSRLLQWNNFCTIIVFLKVILTPLAFPSLFPLESKYGQQVHPSLQVRACLGAKRICLKKKNPMNLIFILMKISFPSKEVYPKFTSVILHGPTVEWRWQGCKGVGAAGGAVPPRERPPPPSRDRYVIWAGRHGDRERSGAAPRPRDGGCTALRGAREPAPNEKIDTTLFGTNPSIKICHVEIPLNYISYLYYLEIS